MNYFYTLFFCLVTTELLQNIHNRSLINIQSILVVLIDILKLKNNYYQKQQM